MSFPSRNSCKTNLFAIRSLAVGGVFILTTIAPASGQEFSTGEPAPLLFDDSSGNGISVAAASAIEISNDETSDVDSSQSDQMVAQVDYQTSVDDGVDVWSELEELQSRVQSQENRLRNLRSGMQSTRVKGHEWFTTYESVLVQPIQSNSTGLIIETPDGYSHVAFPWELEHSPRVQFGAEATGRSLGWRVRFWEFRHTQSFLANDANGLIPLGNEGTVGYLSEDGDITTGLAFIANGTFSSHVRTDVIDWELQRQVAEPLDFYMGIRYGKVAQGYHADTDQGNTNAHSEFRGLGPTVALRFVHVLPRNHFSLFANLRGSLLLGHKEFSVVDDVNNLHQTIGTIDLRSYSDGVDTLSGNAELQLGIQCALADWIALSVALEAQHHSDVGGPNPTGVFTGPDSGLAGDSPWDDNLSFAGLNAGASIIW